MKVLMLGWEFPPNIFGGLDTACYSLTKGLSKLNDVEGSYVVPKLFGSEDKSTIKLFGVIDGSVSNRKVNLKEFGQSVEFIQVNSKLMPCINSVMKRIKITCRVKGIMTLIELDKQEKAISNGKNNPAPLSQLNKRIWDHSAHKV